MIWRLLVLLVSVWVLVKSSDVVIFAARRIAKRTKAGVLVVSILLIALGTSLPELFVGVVSAFEGVSSLSLGVVLGSNIANLSLVGGFAALVAGKVFVKGEVLGRDVLVSFLAGLSPLVLMLDGNLSRVDGLILLSLYGLYTGSLFKERFQEISKGESREDRFHRIFRKLTHISGSEERDFFSLFLGISLMLFSSDLIVRNTREIAMSLGIPMLVVGFFVLAIGTSLPELTFSFRSLEDGAPSMFLGNLLGSTVINSTLVVGLASVISPVTIDTNDYLVAALAFVLVFLAFWYFIRTKHSLERWEALCLVMMYAIFVIVEVI